jgi:hypothetical protein
MMNHELPVAPDLFSKWHDEALESIQLLQRIKQYSLLPEQVSNFCDPRSLPSFKQWQVLPVKLFTNDLYQFKRWHGLDGFGCAKPSPNRRFFLRNAFFITVIRCSTVACLIFSSAVPGDTHSPRPAWNKR